MTPVLSARGVTRAFPLPDGSSVAVLNGVTLEIAAATSTAVMGVSGSGKTTLLHILAGIETADSGAIECVSGRPGLVFQHHHLLPEFDARENIAIAARLAGVATRDAFGRADELLAEVGLSARAKHLPTELSGGEMARVALARALAARPAVILADEPTGSLDEETAARVQDLLFATVRAHGAALVLVTHDPALAARADRTLRLEHGRINC